MRKGPIAARRHQQRRPRDDSHYFCCHRPQPSESLCTNRPAALTESNGKPAFTSTSGPCARNREKIRNTKYIAEERKQARPFCRQPNSLSNLSCFDSFLHRGCLLLSRFLNQIRREHPLQVSYVVELAECSHRKEGQSNFVHVCVEGATGMMAARRPLRVGVMVLEKPNVHTKDTSRIFQQHTRIVSGGGDDDEQCIVTPLSSVDYECENNHDGGAESDTSSVSCKNAQDPSLECSDHHKQDSRNYRITRSNHPGEVECIDDRGVILLQSSPMALQSLPVKEEGCAMDNHRNKKTLSGTRAQFNEESETTITHNSSTGLELEDRGLMTALDQVLIPSHLLPTPELARPHNAEEVIEKNPLGEDASETLEINFCGGGLKTELVVPPPSFHHGLDAADHIIYLKRNAAASSSILKVFPNEAIPINIDGPWSRLKSPSISPDLHQQVKEAPSDRNCMNLLFDSSGREVSIHHHMGKEVLIPREETSNIESSVCGPCCSQPSVKFVDDSVKIRSHAPGATNRKGNQVVSEGGLPLGDRRGTLTGRRSQSTSALGCECGCHKKNLRRRHTVRFDTVYVRSYNQTIGDNPTVSIGTPITLDWSYNEEEPVSIDVFEPIRMEKRKKGNNRVVMNRLVLNYYQRRSRLIYYGGHTEEEIDQAEKEVAKVHRQRNFTALTSDLWWLEDIVRSAGRKVKRLFVRKRAS